MQGIINNTQRFIFDIFDRQKVYFGFSNIFHKLKIETAKKSRKFIENF
jgi:hypothetical protein